MSVNAKSMTMVALMAVSFTDAAPTTMAKSTGSPPMYIDPPNVGQIRFRRKRRNALRDISPPPTISAGSTTTTPNYDSTPNDNSNLGKDVLSLAVRPRKIIFNGSVWKPSSSAFAPVSRNTTPNNNSNSNSPTFVNTPRWQHWRWSL